MRLPPEVSGILSQLTAAGYSAYAVGGCVRDTLLGKVPHDWDLCTSALPEQLQAVFAKDRTVTAGLKHGTLTVIRDRIPYEITTYRIDGDYTDHRHPDSVSFVDRIDLDLSRRDFTVNAMACSPDGAVLDLFCGRQDLEKHLIRCVGEPAARFEEDALRVLRALRFASVFDFELEEKTAAAVRAMYPTLSHVAAERIREELVKLLCGPGAGRILRAYPEVITHLLPELAPAVGFDQKNPHHLYTVWEHTVRALDGVPPDPALRLTMLLHDSGKPYTQTTDEKGICHYKGHQQVSAQIAARAMDALRCDKALRDKVVCLVEAHDILLSTDRRLLLRRLNRFGEDNLRLLFLIHKADRIATGTRHPGHAEEHCLELQAALDALLAEKPCFTLKDLAVNGRDLMSLGLRGKAVGTALSALLDEVMEGTLPNEREALLKKAKKEYL